MLINKIETNNNFAYPFTRVELALNIRDKEVARETVQKLVKR